MEQNEKIQKEKSDKYPLETMLHSTHCISLLNLELTWQHLSRIYLHLQYIHLSTSLLWGKKPFCIQDKLKCLEMRANIKSKWYFTNIFSYNWNLTFWQHSSILTKKVFCQISKCHIYKKPLPHVLGHKKPSGQNNKQTLFFIHW